MREFRTKSTRICELTYFHLKDHIVANAKLFTTGDVYHVYFIVWLHFYTATSALQYFNMYVY